MAERNGCESEMNLVSRSPQMHSERFRDPAMEPSAICRTAAALTNFLPANAKAQEENFLLCRDRGVFGVKALIHSVERARLARPMLMPD